MSTFSPVTDGELDRARSDPAFRQRLLTENLEALLGGLRQLHGTPAPASEGENAKQIREGVELAVKLAELIQQTRPPLRRP
ncbi:MAG TPA: hypothetical protein VMJ52_14705 [Xanthobacteraceae bacterium]|nr:hypothetical protein [Xanthobacteraceae bacterium]